MTGLRASARPIRLIGLDPGLRHTGWGIIDMSGNRLSHVANGAIHSDGDLTLAERLVQLHDGLVTVIDRWQPHEAAVEETFVNKNPASTLKLGMARGVVLLVPAKAGLPVAEYPTNLVKKSVVGAGHADKNQVQVMVGMLLPGVEMGSADAADALAVAICHAHHAATRRVVEAASTTQRQVSPVTEEAKRAPTTAEVSRARRLRCDQTDAETKLWYRLRSAQLGAKFRRQEPILGFTVDFVCHEHRLVIELDGGQHAERVDHDERRSKVLTQAGFRVLRFWSNELNENFDGVLETIAAAMIPVQRGGV